MSSSYITGTGLHQEPPPSRIILPEGSASGFTYSNGGTFNGLDVFVSVPLLRGPGEQRITWSTGGSAAGANAGAFRFYFTDNDMAGGRNITTAAVRGAITHVVSSSAFCRMAWWEVIIQSDGHTMTGWVRGQHGFTNSLDTGSTTAEGTGYMGRIRLTPGAAFLGIGGGWSSGTAGTDTFKIHPITSTIRKAEVR